MMLRRFRAWVGGMLAVICWTAGCLSAVAQARDSFWSAVQANDALAVRGELTRGVNPNLLHPEFGPAIVAAAKDKAFDVVRLLASLEATQLDATNRSDETALMLVCMFGDIRTAQYLIDRGAQVNRPGWTPLHYAATGGHDRLVRFLLERHAFIDAQSPNLTTPLMMAARMKFPSVVRLLIEEGADPTPRNQAGLDAAAYLQRAGLDSEAVWLRERAMQFLLRYGTVEQPRRAEGGAVHPPEPESASSTAASGGGSKAGEFSAIPLARESMVVEEAAPQPPRPGQASTGAVRPAPSGTSTAGTGGAAPNTAPRAGIKPPEPPSARPASPPRPATSANSAAPARSSSGAVGTAPVPPAPTRAGSAGSPVTTAKPATPAAARTEPASPSPALVAPPAVSMPAPPVPIAPVPAIAPVKPVEPEPVFVSRTLSLPEDPPAGAATAPAVPVVEPRAR